MHSLSWRIQNQHLTVLLNHGEFNGRDDAGIFSIREHADTRVLAPLDSKNAQIRVAANEQGLVFCVMNDGSSSDSVADHSYKSRDLIITELAGVKTGFQIREKLAKLLPGPFCPFKLVVFPGAMPPFHWVWNGQFVIEVIAPLPIINAGSVKTSREEKHRVRAFSLKSDRFRKPVTEEDQLALHRSWQSTSSPSSLLSKKAFQNSAILTRITVDPEKIIISNLAEKSALSEDTIPCFTLNRHRKNKVPPIYLPEKQTDNPVNISKIIQEKSPSLHKELSGWKIKAIRWLVRERELNEHLNRIQNLPCNFFAGTVLNLLGVEARLQPGADSLPASSCRPVFMSNHPSGGLDGLILLDWIAKYYPDVRIIVNDLLWHLTHMRPYVVPVDLFGDNRNAVKTVFEAFEGDAPLLIFPAGKAARKIKGKLTESEWQKNPVKLARKYRRTIVPIHMQGFNSALFYGLASIRRTLRIRTNLEMLLLSREFLRPACKEFRVWTGTALLPGQVKALGKNDDERTSRLQKITLELPRKASAANHAQPKDQGINADGSLRLGTEREDPPGQK